jgi:hypothetical protein
MYYYFHRHYPAWPSVKSINISSCLIVLSLWSSLFTLRWEPSSIILSVFRHRYLWHLCRWLSSHILILRTQRDASWVVTLNPGWPFAMLTFHYNLVQLVSYQISHIICDHQYVLAICLVQIKINFMISYHHIHWLSAWLSAALAISLSTGRYHTRYFTSCDHFSTNWQYASYK